MLKADQVFPSRELHNGYGRANKRASGYPLPIFARNMGFYPAFVSGGRGCIDPRGDTEVLCEQAIRFVGEKPMTVLDFVQRKRMHCGDGCERVSGKQGLCVGKIGRSISVSDREH